MESKKVDGLSMDYSTYGLSTNPFVGTVPQKHVSFCVTREKELELVSWTLRSAFSGVSTHTVIVGGYGNGKTHLLRYVESQVNERPNRKALAIYVHSPGENFRQLYSVIVLSLGRTFFEDLVWKYLGIACLSAPKKLLEGLPAEKLEAIKKNPEVVREYVERGEILLSDLIDHAKDLLSRQVVLLDFTTAFLHLILGEYSLLAWKWLAAEDMPYEQRKDLSLSMAINNDDRALRALLSLKTILHDVGYDLIVLLIDEFEMIAVLPERSRQRVLNEVRHLIDLAPSGLCIFLGCAPEAWRIIVSEYHAFLERFTHVIFLKPLDQQQVHSLISTYLERARLNDDPNDQNEIYPFSEDLIEQIYRVALGNVRNTLKLCQVSIDYGIMNEYNILTTKLLREKLESLFPDLLEATEGHEI